MTTIATDGKSMAADRLAHDNTGVVMSYRPKMARLKDGRIVGVTGSSFDFDAIVGWLEGGGGPDTMPKVWEKTEFLVLMPDGDVRSYDDSGRFVSGELLPTGIGSGMGLAIGAMEAGATPAEAVAIAIKRHTGSGGTIDEEAL